MVIESDGPIMIGKLQLVFKMCKKKKCIIDIHMLIMFIYMSC